MIRYSFAVVACLAICGNASHAESNVEGMIREASSTYRSALESPDRNHQVQQFRTAESLFAKVIATQSDGNNAAGNAELYVNLGNAALGAEHAGVAILAYRRALKANPSHARAKQNLQHARSLLADWIPKPDDQIALGSFFDWTRNLAPQDWRGLAAISFLIAAFCLAFFLRTGGKALRNIGCLLAIAWLAVLAATFFRTGNSEGIAVVVVPETTARSADSLRAPARFPEPLPSGTEVQVVEDRGEWLRVRLFDGREVWLTRSAVDTV